MDATLRTFAPHALALLIGGLSASLGVTYVARRPRVQSVLASIRLRTLGAGCLAAAGLAAAAIYTLVRPALQGALSDPRAVTPWRFLAIGASVGLPLGLPGVIAAWSEAGRAQRARLKRRDWVPTKDDRRAYATELAGQIAEISPRPRALTASISGDGGTILSLEGEIDAEEGERLTAALRSDLREIGFKRVEGRNGSEQWWARV